MPEFRSNGHYDKVLSVSINVTDAQRPAEAKAKTSAHWAGMYVPVRVTGIGQNQRIHRGWAWCVANFLHPPLNLNLKGRGTNNQNTGYNTAALLVEKSKSRPLSQSTTFEFEVFVCVWGGGGF